MSFLKVHTAQNVLLEYPVSNIGHRIAAAIIDLVICGLYIWLIQFAFDVILDIQLFTNNPDILFFFIVILPVLIYLPTIEYFWNGKTVGKYFLKLKVVKSDGTAASLGDYILRWLLRTIDIKLGFLFIFFIPRTPTNSIEEIFMIWAIILLIIPLPVVGFISMATSPTCQRIGDRVANTVVIRHRRPFSIEDTILRKLEGDYEPRYRNVLTLSDRDIYIIKNVLDNFNKTGNHEPVIDLGEKAKTVLNIQDDIKPYELLHTLVKDYNYLAKEKDQVDINA